MQVIVRNHRIIGSLLASALLLGVTTARADNCSGTEAQVNRVFEKLEISKGDVMSLFANHSVIASADFPNANGQMGECFGTWLDTADGKSRGMGFCAWKDKDGDSEYIQWEAGPDGGKWRDVAGTGKWAAKASSGWSRMVAIDGKTSLARWGGNCKN